MKRDFRALVARVIGRETLAVPVVNGIPLMSPRVDSFPEVGLDILANLRTLADVSDNEAMESAERERRLDVLAAYGFQRVASPDKPFAFSNGYAIIPIMGTLINRFSYSWGGWITGYNYVQAMTLAALADPDVTTIIYDVDSPGGSVSGCFELSDFIFNSRGQKPMVAMVDGACCSAAYALASAADKIYTTPSSYIGSVGVYSMHIDISDMLAEHGVKVTLIYAGDHKVDGNPFQPLPSDVKADIQRSIDKTFNAFVSLVARNRSMTADNVQATQARVYDADDAKSVGFIDGIYSPPQAIDAMLAAMSEAESDDPDEDDQPDDPETDNPQEEQAMTEQNTATVATERARVKAIMTHAEAEGRQDLAAHLAFDTSLSAEEAGAILAKAPKAAPAAAAPTTEKPEANHFRQAMDNGRQPNIPTGENEGAPDAETLTPAQRASLVTKALKAKRNAAGLGYSGPGAARH